MEFIWVARRSFERGMSKPHIWRTVCVVRDKLIEVTDFKKIFACEVFQNY